MSIMTITSNDTDRAPVPAAPARRAGGPVRLTRRGRLVILLLAVTIVLGIGFVLAGGSMATDEAGTPEPTRVVLVDTGETLWDIAAGLDDAGDVRAMVDRIMRLNALDSSMLVAGQRILVPIS